MEKYEVPKSIITEQNLYVFSQARRRNCEYQCYIGTTPEYRIGDDFGMNDGFKTLSNPRMVFLTCIFPTYLKEGQPLIHEVMKNINKMIASDNVVELLQAARFLFDYTIIKEEYEVPFELNTEQIAADIRREVEKRKPCMQSYREGEFISCISNMYQMADGMLNYCQKGN